MYIAMFLIYNCIDQGLSKYTPQARGIYQGISKVFIEQIPAKVYLKVSLKVSQGISQGQANPCQGISVKVYLKVSQVTG